MIFVENVYNKNGIMLSALSIIIIITSFILPFIYLYNSEIVTTSYGPYNTDGNNKYITTNTYTRNYNLANESDIELYNIMITFKQLDQGGINNNGSCDLDWCLNLINYYYELNSYKQIVSSPIGSLANLYHEDDEHYLEIDLIIKYTTNYCLENIYGGSQFNVPFYSYVNSTDTFNNCTSVHWVNESNTTFDYLDDLESTPPYYPLRLFNGYLEYFLDPNFTLYMCNDSCSVFSDNSRYFITYNNRESWWEILILCFSSSGITLKVCSFLFKYYDFHKRIKTNRNMQGLIINPEDKIINEKLIDSN